MEERIAHRSTLTTASAHHLVTTTTTVLGLVPLALGTGEGAEIQQPLAITIISGLTSATILTLGVIPVVYQTLTRLLERKPSPAEAGP